MEHVSQRLKEPKIVSFWLGMNLTHLLIPGIRFTLVLQHNVWVAYSLIIQYETAVKTCCIKPLYITLLLFERKGQWLYWATVACNTKAWRSTNLSHNNFMLLCSLCVCICCFALPRKAQLFHPAHYKKINTREK